MRPAVSSSLRSAWLLVERVDRGDADAEPREDLREVLEVAHQGSAPRLEVELVRNDERVAGLQHLRLEAAATEEAAPVRRGVDGAVGAQDEHVLGVGGFVGAGEAQVVARGPARLPDE